MSADRRWRHVEVDFVTDEGEVEDALAALAAQVEDLDRASVKLVYTGDPVCDACGQVSEGDQHACWLTPAVDPTALLGFLHELAALAETAVRMAAGAGRASAFLRFSDRAVDSEWGLMRLEDFRAHYGGAT